MNPYQVHSLQDRAGVRPAVWEGRGAAPELPLKVTCAWCDELIEDGPGEVSHGMCDQCHDEFLALMLKG